MQIYNVLKEKKIEKFTRISLLSLAYVGFEIFIDFLL